MTTFIGSNDADTIAPGLITPGVVVLGPDPSPGAGDDLILARGGDDIVAGGRGDDTAALGTGRDVFGWAPGDGSDTVFGQGGFDTLAFDGNGADETFQLTHANGTTRFDRDVGAIAMRMTGVERIDLFAGGGVDVVRVGQGLNGSAVEELRIDLSGVKGSHAGDGAVDRVELSDGNGDSFVSILGQNGGAAILGLPVFVGIDGGDMGDTIAFHAGGGADNLAASRDLTLRLDVDAGAGDDVIASGGGDDMLRGGAGRDFVSGGRGNDRAWLGAGDDVFAWDNGDGSDVVDGNGGRDALVFNGFAAAETFCLTAAAAQAVLTRDLGNIRMDMTSIEAVTIRAFGGADAISLGDMTGSTVRAVEVAMSLPGLAGDGAADAVTVEGGAAGEQIDIASGGGSLVTVDGLHASVDVFGAEAIDTLTVQGGGGTDFIRARDVAAGQVHLVLDGGAGQDFVFGSQGADVVLGGAGNDVIASDGGDDSVSGGLGDDGAILGDGDDRFTWNPGDGNDEVAGGAGIDSFDFVGAAVDEAIEIAAVGTDAVMTAQAILPGGATATARLLTETVERLEFQLDRGTDEVTVRDLAPTTVDEVVIDLSGPDGAADLVTVAGTAGDDHVVIRMDGDAIVVDGLGATVRIVGFESLDQVQFRGLDGDDTLDASGLGGMQLFVQGGNGRDVIFGSGGNDVLSGDGGDDVIAAGAGDDVCFGGAGADVLDGGAGTDILTGGAGIDVILNGEVVFDPLLAA